MGPSRKVSHSETVLDHRAKSCHMPVEARYQSGLPNHLSFKCLEPDFQQQCVCVMCAVPMWISVQLNTSWIHQEKALWIGFSQSVAFPSMSVQLIPVICRSLHPRKIQSIISTGRAITQSYGRHWWACFWTWDVGCPGSVHDARVLANASLYNTCESDDLYPNWTTTPTTIGNTTIPLVIFKDHAHILFAHGYLSFS